MTIEQAYEKMGADYNGVLTRFMSEALVTRFAGKFLTDPSFDALKNALAAKDVTSAFCAAHTLKGICLNLGFDNLYKPSSELTELLRAGTMDGSEELMKQVEDQYAVTINALHEALGK